jgi:hypothetical protein
VHNLALGVALSARCSACSSLPPLDRSFSARACLISCLRLYLVLFVVGLTGLAVLSEVPLADGLLARLEGLLVEVNAHLMRTSVGSSVADEAYRDSDRRVCRR